MISASSKAPYSSVIALGGMLALCVFGCFASGSPLEQGQSISLSIAGLLLIAFPPNFRVPWWIWIPACLFLMLASLSFLPKEWAIQPEWRQALEANGINTGGLIHIHPRQGLEYSGRVVIAVIMISYLFGHQVSSLARYRLVLLCCVGLAGYALTSAILDDLKVTSSWDLNITLGFFPNHNLTASLLVIGVLVGAGATMEAFRRGSTTLVAVPILTSCICAWTLFAYSGTRMGPILLALGGTMWLVALGKKYYSRNFLIFGGVVLAAVAVVSLTLESEVKTRLLSIGGEVAEAALGSSNNESSNSNPSVNGEYPDFRLPVYLDTLKMIRAEPWTGVGLGMFKFVFPQYRDLTINTGTCLHPESDWWWVAAESGVPAALVMALAMGFILFKVTQTRLGQRSWALDSACLIAAAIIPFHGLVDIPGHSSALVLTAAWLVAIIRLDVGLSPAMGWIGKSTFRIFGLLILAVGGYLGHSAWNGGELLSISSASHHADQVKPLHDQYLASLKAAAQTSAVPDFSLLDQAEQALDAALKITPLESELYFQRGGLALHRPGPNSITDRSFVIHRLLAPNKPDVAERQAAIWVPYDFNRSISLYSLAMKAADRPQFRTNSNQVYSKALFLSSKSPQALSKTFALAGVDEEKLALWVWSTPMPLVNQLLPRLVYSINEPLVAQRLLMQWHTRNSLGINAL